MLEQQAKGKPHLRIAIFIVAIHVVFLGGLLIQGCKKEDAKITPPKDNAPLTDISQPAPTNPGSNGMTGLLPGPEALPAASNSLSGGLPPVTVSSNLPSQPLTGVTPPPEPGPGFVTPGATPGPGLAPVPGAGLAPAPSGQTEHIVASGDNYYTLAKKYGVSMKAIAEANPGVDAKKLQLKQKLIIPAAAPKHETAATTPGATPLTAAPAGATEPAPSATEKSYKVKSGDNLSKIARAHGVSVRDLQAVNHLKTTQIKVGDKLVIPPSKSKTAAPETTALPAPAPAPVTPAPAAPVFPPPTTPGATIPSVPATNR